MAKKTPPQPDFIIPEAGPLRHTRATVPQKPLAFGGGPPKTQTHRQLFLEAYEGTFGNISWSCEYASISRRTFYRWRRRAERDGKKERRSLSQGARTNLRFFERLEFIKPVERKKDFLEGALMQRVAAGDTQAIVFGLKTQARDRGYTEKLEISQAMDESVAAELAALRAKIEHVAAKFETDYPSELKLYLDEFGARLHPVIREKLVSELEQ